MKYKYWSQIERDDKWWGMFRHRNTTDSKAGKVGKLNPTGKARLEYVKLWTEGASYIRRKILSSDKCKLEHCCGIFAGDKISVYFQKGDWCEDEKCCTNDRRRNAVIWIFKAIRDISVWIIY